MCVGRCVCVCDFAVPAENPITNPEKEGYVPLESLDAVLGLRSSASLGDVGRHVSLSPVSDADDEVDDECEFESEEPSASAPPDYVSEEPSAARAPIPVADEPNGMGECVYVCVWVWGCGCTRIYVPRKDSLCVVGEKNGRVDLSCR